MSGSQVRQVAYFARAGLYVVGSMVIAIAFAFPLFLALRERRSRLTVLGMNVEELAANPAAAVTVVHDLNAEPVLPFDDEAFDAVVCCVSVDYLVRPVEVFTDVRRVLRPGGPFVCTMSNRLFPTKAIRGWFATGDQGHTEIVAAYFEAAGGWDEPVIQRRTPEAHSGDPLYAVWAHKHR